MFQRLHIKKQRFAKIFVKIIGILGIFLSALFVSPHQIYAGSCSQVTENGQESIKIVADPNVLIRDANATISMICTVANGSSTIQVPSDFWTCDLNGRNCSALITPTADSNNCSEYRVIVDYIIPTHGPVNICQTTYKIAVSPDTIQNVQNHCGTVAASGILSVCRINGTDTRSYVPCGSDLNRLGSVCCENGTYCAQKLSIQRQPVDPKSFDLCAQTGDPGKCNDCKTKYTDENGKPVGLWTAIGCINPTKEGITSSVIKLGLGIGGGVVLLMILAASFKLTTSKGDPKATEEAKEMITNAIGGLLFILFSVVLIRTIGRGLLQIPGF